MTANGQLHFSYRKTSQGIARVFLPRAVLLCVQNSNDGLYISKFIIKSSILGSLKLFDAALNLWADLNKMWLYDFCPSQGQGTGQLQLCVRRILGSDPSSLRFWQIPLVVMAR